MKNYISSIILVFSIMIIWEIGARVVNMAFILPSPTGIFIRLWELKSILILEHLPATVLIIVIGLAISILLGISLAIWMYVSKAVENALYPIIITSQTIPIIA